jgi:hypothetical protein
MPSTTDLFLNVQRFLRCRKSHRYFTGNGWTDDPSLAQAFPEELEAARACVTHNLRDVELVLCTHSTGTELFTTLVR